MLRETCPTSTLRGVRKTSVYLPDELKAQLASFSRQTQRSEAELIREAVEQLVRRKPGPVAPTSQSAVKGPPRIIAVGVGPGDPDLLTDRALAVLRRADRVFAASTGTDAIGRAEMIVRAAAPDVAVYRLPITIAGDTTLRASSVSAAVQALIDTVDAGQVAAFVTLGDPNVFTVFPAMARLIVANRPDIIMETVPGVMAFQELAARTSTVVAEDDGHVLMVHAADSQHLRADDLDDPRCTVVVYKGGRELPRLAERLAAHHRLDGAVLGEMLGLPGGRAVAVDAVADRPASYLATVVIPAIPPLPSGCVPAVVAE